MLRNHTLLHLSALAVASIAAIEPCCAAQSAPGGSREAQPDQPLPVDPAQIVSSEPAPGAWQLDFKIGELRLYQDPVTQEAYWYLTYKVVNRTGQDRWWGPKFELYDDRGGLARSGRNVPVIVSKRIESLLGNPLVEDQYQVLGEIRQGEANAKEGFVVWPAGAAESTELTIFVRGVSSEVKAIPDPKSGEARQLHKTVKFEFRVSGDPRARGSQPVPCEQTQWIMR
jgi:hypothetical protein